MKKKSIKSYLVKQFVFVVGIAFLLIFFVTFYIVARDMENIKKQSISRMVADGAANITARIDEMFASAYTIASDEMIANPNIPFEEKKAKLEKYGKDREISSLGYISAEGYLISTDGFENDISERQYYKDLMQGGLYISYPQFNTATQKQIIFIGVPRYYEGKIVGAMTCCFDSSKLSELVSSLSYMDQGEAYMISDTGITIASYQLDDVLNSFNILEAAKEDSGLKEEADVHQYMLDHDAGYTKFGKEFLFFDKVQDGANWTLIFKISESFFYKEIMKLIGIFAVFLVLGIVVVCIVSFRLGSRFGNRLMRLKGHLGDVAEGDFLIELEQKELEEGDEIGEIYRSLERILMDVGNALNSMKNITVDLASHVTVLNETSTDLEDGTSKVSVSVGEITTGNSEQASEINIIYDEMEKFGANVEKVNTNIDNVVKITSSANEKLLIGNEDMGNLQASFAKFNENFEEFRRILQTMNESLNSINMITSAISEIADQTNLLSLNASIEAARAGEAGKGFSVVAQEISKLAEQCSESVKEISNVISMIMNSGHQLIESTSVMDHQMEQQAQMIGETLEAFSQLSCEMEEMIPQIANISQISRDNLDASQIIGKSIENVNTISEELVNTTLSVSDASENFSSSSRNIGDASKSLQQISDQLSELASNFKA